MGSKVASFEADLKAAATCLRSFLPDTPRLRPAEVNRHSPLPLTFFITNWSGARVTLLVITTPAVKSTSFITQTDVVWLAIFLGMPLSWAATTADHNGFALKSVDVTLRGRSAQPTRVGDSTAFAVRRFARWRTNPRPSYGFEFIVSRSICFAFNLCGTRTSGGW